MIDDDMKDQMTLFQIPSKAPKEKPEPKPAPAPPAKKQAPRQSAAPPQSKRNAPAPRKKAPPPPPRRPVSGQVPEGDVRLTANIREDLHLKLKIAAAKRRTTIGELIEEFVETYL